MNWDVYFYNLCEVVSSRSRCNSRNIGAILTIDNVVVATGYNGPPRGVKHCGRECPRKVKGYSSGEGLHICPAVHAEENCVANAARVGSPVKNSVLYLNDVIPCSRCMGIIINSGVMEVVCVRLAGYDGMGKRLADEGGIRLREFVTEE